jgi:hypothetical protein
MAAPGIPCQLWARWLTPPRRVVRVDNPGRDRVEPFPVKARRVYQAFGGPWLEGNALRRRSHRYPYKVEGDCASERRLHSRDGHCRLQQVVPMDLIILSFCFFLGGTPRLSNGGM